MARVSARFKHWSQRLLTPDRVLLQTFEAFKSLLACDGQSHGLMTEFEQVYHLGKEEDLARTRHRYGRLSQAVDGMVTALEQMNPGPAGLLREYFNKYDFYCRLLLAPPEQFFIPPFAVGHQTPADASLVGNKSHNLRRIQAAGLAHVPDGFTITSTTYARLIEHNRLRPALDLLLAAIDPDSQASLDQASQALMTLVGHMEFPADVTLAMTEEFDRLAARCPRAPLRVAVRSSALHEDSRHSFAGQYRTVLNVGRDELQSAYLKVLASKYTPQALRYRMHAGLADEETAMAVLVVEMVAATAAGVVYTLDPESGDRQSLQVHAVRGLGQTLVEGETVPDVFLFAGRPPQPVATRAGSQEQALLLAQGRLSEQAVSPSAGAEKLAVSPEEAAALARLGMELETFFGEPQDIEWALAGEGGPVILQSRPLRPGSSPAAEDAAATPPAIDLPPLLTGARCAASGLATGTVVHWNTGALRDLPDRTVLVSRHIPPSLVRHIDRLAAVVCEQGSITGHFSTVCREFGVVLLVEAKEALRLLQPESEVTVSGTAGTVYAGSLPGQAVESAGKSGVPATDFARRLRTLLDHIVPLCLQDPDHPEFRPQGCRSLHDIIRYAHETAIRTMFGLSGLAPGQSARRRTLDSELPLVLQLLDVGGAFAEGSGDPIGAAQLRSEPFAALWQGLNHPGIDWQSHSLFDWQGFGDMALSGGVVSGEAKEFASYAILGQEYCNLNLRFGFHFTVVDSYCARHSPANYFRLRFAGGGGTPEGREVRLELLSRILLRLGCEVRVQGDVLDARIDGWPEAELTGLLTEIGRLLGMTKQLDLILRAEDIDHCTTQFFDGVGRFTSPRM